MPELSRDVIKKIRTIQMQTMQLADEMMAGEWHSAFKGQGMEFEEVREYQAGDDIRTIDWNVTARMDHPYVKVFKEARELTVLLLVDVSASSRFGSQNQLKRDLIAEIAAVLAFSAIKNNDNIGLILFSNEIEKYIPPRKGTRHVLRVIRELLAFEPKGHETDLTCALSFLGSVQQKKGICFLISDFLCPYPFHEFSVTSKHHDLISISVTDPYELDFPKIGYVNLMDLESGETELIDSSDKKVQQQFKQRGANRLKQFDQLMKKIGAGYVEIRTDKSYLNPMRKFFKLRGVRH